MLEKGGRFLLLYHSSIDSSINSRLYPDPVTTPALQHLPILIHPTNPPAILAQRLTHETNLLFPLTSARKKMPRETKVSSEPAALAVKRKLGINELMIKKKRTWRQVKQLVSAEYFDLLPATAPTYSSIEAPPSMLPSKKYCDITGFPVGFQLPF